MNAADFDFTGGLGVSNWLKNLQTSSSMPGTNGVGNSGGVAGMNPTSPSTGGLGFNMDTMKLGLGGLQTIGNLWNAFQANKLAKDTFNYQKNVTDQNMANSLQSYNTSLADRIRSRTYAEGGSQQSADQYLEKNSLRRQY